jgi:outer membrane lipoprotein-sorting protein
VPTEIICLIYSMLIYWAGLQKQEIVTRMEHGAAALKSVALHFQQQVQQEGDEPHSIIKIGMI